MGLKDLCMHSLQPDGFCGVANYLSVFYTQNLLSGVSGIRFLKAHDLV